MKEGARRFLVTGGSGFIGSHLMNSFRSLPDTEAVNFDLNPPSQGARDDWIEGDILDLPALVDALREVQPTHIVHLAAKVDIQGKTIDDYLVNTEGCANVLEAIRQQPSVQRSLFVSTQFVCRPGYQPNSDRDYSPHTIYGESKAICEDLVRDSNLGSEWMIVRPTTIWGPGDLLYREQFYRVLDRGLYFHPGTKPCHRSYGYVGNVVSQIHRLAELPAEVVHGATFYVGDDMIDVIEFVDEFSRQLKGRSARVVPAWFVRSLAFFGDALARIGILFPITSGRYRSMTEDYPVPIARTIEILGPGPADLAEGVAHTLASLRSSGVIKTPA